MFSSSLRMDKKEGRSRTRESVRGSRAQVIGLGDEGASLRESLEKRSRRSLLLRIHCTMQLPGQRWVKVGPQPDGDQKKGKE